MMIPTPLDDELRFLLDAVAGGFFQGDACLFCGARLIMMNTEVMTNIHVSNCPVLRARKLLAQEGFPVKMFSISFETTHPPQETRQGVTLQVIRSTLSEEDALDRVMDSLADWRGKRRLVEGSRPNMREAVMKCNVAKFILGIWPEKLFCDEFMPVIFAFARYT